MTERTIIPSDELIGKWIDTDEGGPNVISRIATRAAQWGADQELEACCEWLVSEGWFKYEHEAVEDLRAARRSKPPRLKEQALEALAHILNNSSTQLGADTIRRALEALPE
jgi:hypothetical protein